VERQPTVQPRVPTREPPRLKLAGEEVAIGIVDLGDVEVEQCFLKADRLPEEDHDRPRPDPQGQRIGRPPPTPLELPDGRCAAHPLLSSQPAHGHDTIEIPRAWKTIRPPECSAC